MKKILVILSLFWGTTSPIFATNLLDTYQQALCSDQIFQQAVNQRLSDKQGVPISLSALLPSLGVIAQPNISKSNISGSGATFVGSNTERGYSLTLTLNQTVFNFAQFANLRGAKALSKQADATLNAAAQDLMVRVAKAYFAVLNDEDNLRYTLAAKKAYAKQLDQTTQQYKVGLKTITDVYTARASYENSVADYITAENQLQDDKENLRVITGVYYPHLSKLSEKFPYISPNPSNMESWVKIALCQNWAIKAALYFAESARQNIKQQFAGHLPNLVAQASYGVNFTRVVSSNIAGEAVLPPVPTPTPSPLPIPVDEDIFPTGATRTTTTAGSLILNIPLVQGGYVTASTQKAKYDYKIATSQLEQQIRNTSNMTRQNYLNILSGISKIKADKETIKSSISALDGMRAAYEVGTGTLVDVLNQQQKVYLAQKQYASDRYNYVNSLLALKAAAGTLSVCDLQAINRWLINANEIEDDGARLRSNTPAAENLTSL